MARKKKEQTEPSEETESQAGEQLDLIDVTPDELKGLKPIAEKYRSVVRRRINLQNEEKELKDQILSAIKTAHLQRLSDGKIRFRLDHMIITVTPRDELVQVEEEKGAAE